MIKLQNLQIILILLSKIVKLFSSIARTKTDNIIDPESRCEERFSSSRNGLTQKFVKQTPPKSNIQLDELN